VSLWLDFRIALATVLKMAGLPFRVLRKMFFFPEQAAVESAYKQRVQVQTLRA
jgi:hypothetical protein